MINYVLCEKVITFFEISLRKLLTLVLLFFTGCQKGPQENVERK